jgi:hypothetical protein
LGDRATLFLRPYPEVNALIRMHAKGQETFSSFIYGKQSLTMQAGSGTRRRKPKALDSRTQSRRANPLPDAAEYPPHLRMCGIKMSPSSHARVLCDSEALLPTLRNCSRP